MTNPTYPMRDVCILKLVILALDALLSGLIRPTVMHRLIPSPLRGEGIRRVHIHRGETRFPDLPRF